MTPSLKQRREERAQVVKTTKFGYKMDVVCKNENKVSTNNYLRCDTIYSSGKATPRIETQASYEKN